MVAEIILSVLSPFVTKITEDFLGRRRATVAVADLQDQVVRLMASHRELEIEVAQARLAVVALTRYLVMTQGEIFALQGDHLTLEIKPRRRRQVILGQVLDDFSSSVESSISKRQTLRPEFSPDTPPQPSPLTRSASKNDSTNETPAAPNKALSGFFDGFEEEIMRARLGQEETE